MNIGFLSNWSRRCGIAVHQRYLADVLKKAGNEIRIYRQYSAVDDLLDTWGHKVFECYHRGQDPSDRQGISVAGILEDVVEHKIDVFHIQGFDMRACDVNKKLIELLKELKRLHVKVFETFHASCPSHDFEDGILDGGIVHDERTLNFFKGYLPKVPIYWIRMGVPELVKLSKEEKEVGKKEILRTESKHVVGSFGMMRNEYGTTLPAIAELRKTYPDILYVIHVSREEYLGGVVALIQKLGLEKNVRLTSKWMEPDELHVRFSCCDILLFHYSCPNMGATSSAAHVGIGMHIPVITTNATFFDSVRGYVFEIPCSSNPTNAVQATNTLFLEKNHPMQGDFYSRFSDKADEYAKENSWEKVAKRHIEIYEKGVEK